jgi:hypothetical protein
LGLFLRTQDVLAVEADLVSKVASRRQGLVQQMDGAGEQELHLRIGQPAQQTTEVAHTGQAGAAIKARGHFVRRH